MTRALTLGFFDGVHLGHQAVVQRCREWGFCTCVTFPEHPALTLGRTAPPLLCSPEHKIDLLKQAGADEVIVIPFDANLAQLEPEAFLKQFTFDHLILGHDARFGHKRSGTPERLQDRFSVEYLPPVSLEGTISSSRIRTLVEGGDLEGVARLLGRRLSYGGPIIHGEGKGRAIGYPTANLDVSGLCVPTYGVYAVTLNGKPGVANLGVAPTLQTDRRPTLEVHLFESPGDLYGQNVEVTLFEFLRPEQRFPSVEALRAQIAQDVRIGRLKVTASCS